jgi:hypothetical protein
MAISRQTILAKFDHIRDTMFPDARLTCTFRGQTFTASKTTLSYDEVTKFYGGFAEYSFSLYVSSDDLTIDDTLYSNLITFAGSPNLVGQDTTMSVMGMDVDPLGGVIRLDLQPEHSAE